MNSTHALQNISSNEQKWSWSQISFGDSALARDKVLKLEKQNLNLTELISILERIEREKDQEVQNHLGVLYFISLYFSYVGTSVIFSNRLHPQLNKLLT